MTRTRPRNCYRSPIMQAITFRAWVKRMGQQDLTRQYIDTMTEITMQNDGEIEISIRGRDRVLLLPRVSLSNVSPALERLDWFRRTAVIDQRIAERAEAALNAIARAST